MDKDVNLAVDSIHFCYANAELRIKPAYLFIVFVQNGLDLTLFVYIRGLGYGRLKLLYLN